MDYLRDRVRLRAYGQLDPLIEYKNEGFKMFNELLKNLEANIVQMILKVSIQEKIKEPEPFNQVAISNKAVVQGKEKPGRNDPCPCGSNKKYKKCCSPKFG